MTDKTDRKINHTSPFRVPDGYFDSLTERVMSRIPANEVRMIDNVAPARRFGWHRYAAAAAVVAALFGAGIYFGHKPAAETPMAEPVAVNAYASNHSDDAYGGDFDNVADYIMCDDYDLYAYLSNENE